MDFLLLIAGLLFGPLTADSDDVVQQGSDTGN